MGTRVLFNLDFNAVDGGGNSYAKYRVGEAYAVTEETTRLVAAGIAETVDVPDDPEPAAAPSVSPVTPSPAAPATASV